MKLRSIIFAAALVLPATGAFAQPVMPPMKTIAESADVQALLAKAKTMPPKAMISQNIVAVPPYVANLEYRNGPKQEAGIHPKEVELIYVVDGAGTWNTGGTIANGAITGGTSQHVTKGDFLFVPSNTPHQMIPDAGGEAHMSIHIPVAAAAQ
jgi:mannose-6-phosphate isomerase-like protein (cupin superfamily)